MLLMINKKTNQPYDKIYRKILSNKIQVVGLLNRYIKTEEKITEDNIERYQSKFVNAQFENRESDIVYKIKNTNVFFLIEHQSRIDYNMAQRIAEYQMEIIKLENPKKENRKNIVVPLVIPLVIYTSNKAKWNAQRSITKMQPKVKGYKRLGLSEYHLLDINSIDVNQLLHENLFVLRIFGLEKAKTQEELGNIFEYILHTEQDKENIQLLKEIAYYVYNTVLENEKVKEKFEELEEGEENMSFVDMLLEEKEKHIAEGEKLGIKKGRSEGEKIGRQQGEKIGRQKGAQIQKEKIAKNLLNLKMKIQDIERATGLSESEIKKLQKTKS